MTLIVNLSTIHDYSITETASAFAKLCNKFSGGCLQCMPGLFQHGTNYAWVMAQYQLNYKSHIEPYRLGNISTDEFLQNLAEIFYFMDEENDMGIHERNRRLAKAWNASIKMSPRTDYRLCQLAERAQSEPVYLISNTNELNMQVILDLFIRENPDLVFNNVDINIRKNREPLEILPNVFLCLSYQFKTFKSEAVTTGTILEELVTRNSGQHITVVSQFEGDRNKSRQLKIMDVQTDEEFYHSASATMKKIL